MVKAKNWKLCCFVIGLSYDQVSKNPRGYPYKDSASGGLFLKEPNILFAYLFGGLLKKTPGPMSDVDLAVYVKNPK